jgi:hypothetical protein
MIKKLFVLSLVLQSFLAFSQTNYVISGHIKDSKNGESIIGATAYVKELNKGTVSNEYGFYSLSLPAGNYTLVFSFVGFQSKIVAVDLNKNQKLEIELKESQIDLNEVTVTEKREEENIKNIEMSVNKMDIKTIGKVPALLGEVDVIRTIQLLPGVSTVGEGASGFNVRGGGIDQNLVLLDEAPVYNSSHLFGFFSVFNPDAVSDVKLIKGGIPSKYGGRISSILDVRMKEGNSKKLGLQGGIGAIFSRLTLEAPIVKDKGSFILAARRSYIDVLAKPFLTDDLKSSKFNFYDLTAKANYTINEKNRLFLSGYFGRDVFGAPGFIFNWGNSTATLRWNHLYSDKLFMNFTSIYSNYDYELGFGEQGKDAFNWKSKIINYSIKPDFTYYLNTKNTITFGAQSMLYDFVPGSANFTNGGKSNDISLPDKFAMEHGIYLGNEQTLGARFSLQYGLRYSFYQYLGKGTSYEYANAAAGQRKTVISSTQYNNGEIIEQYGNWEPRVSMKYELTESSSIKTSFNRIAQYIHLISNTTASTPLDVWTPSTNNIKPQIVDQYTIGYFKNFGKNNMFESSVELYYKDLQNQIDYIDNANLLLNEFLEGDLLAGKARAYGSEWYIRKTRGKFTGWISYTLARTERKVQGINLGNWYPSRFDKMHNATIVASYEINKRLTLSSDFVFSTGTPATFPTNRIEWQGYVIPHNSQEKRNNYRIPNYSRLDFSLMLKNKEKEGKKFESYWVFSVYNVYSRRNAFSVFFQQNENNPLATEAIRYSILGTVVPAVSYNFKF